MHVPSTADRPEALQYAPAVQTVLTERPVVLQNEPGVQGMWRAKASDGQKEWTGHTIALELRVGQYVPLEHVACVADDEPVGQ